MGSTCVFFDKCAANKTTNVGWRLVPKNKKRMIQPIQFGGINHLSGIYTVYIYIYILIYIYIYIDIDIYNNILELSLYSSDI